MPLELQVLKSWTVDLGDRAIVLNRVTPPVLPERPAVVALPAPPLSAEDMQSVLRRQGKKHEVLFLSATVYDRKFSEVRWMTKRAECRVVSTIDFNLVPCMGTFESADTVYSLLLAVANKTTAANGVIVAAGPPDAKPILVSERFPSLEKLDLSRAEYLALGDGPAAIFDQKDFTAMDALHAYFDANPQQLMDEHSKFEAARIEKERMPENPPPKPKEAIINYWIGQGATGMIDRWTTGVRP